MVSFDVSGRENVPGIPGAYATHHKTRKFRFCVTATARPLFVHWTPNTAVVAQHVMQRRQSGGRTIAMVAQGLPWSPDGGTMIAQWSAKGGTVVVQWRQKHRANWYTLFTTVRINLRGDQWPNPVHPFYDHGDVCAFLLPPLSDLRPTDRPARWPLCDCFEYAQQFTTAMASMTRSERPLCHPWTTKANSRPPLCLQRRPGQFCGRTREVQRSQPLCKRGKIKWMKRFFACLWVILLQFSLKSRLIPAVLELGQVRLFWKLNRSRIWQLSHSCQTGVWKYFPNSWALR